MSPGSTTTRGLAASGCRRRLSASTARITERFRRDHPGWDLAYDLERTLREIHDTNLEHWSAGVAGPAAVAERV